jgi:segregation and condensation protein B
VNTSNPQNSPFTEAELAQVAPGPVGEPELEDVDSAEIDERGPTPDLDSFERLVAQSRELPTEGVRCVVESLLFVAQKPLSVFALHETTGIERPRLEEALAFLVESHRERGSGMTLQEVGGGFQFRTASGSASYVRRFLRLKPQKLTRAAVETLAIIAYRQPVTRPEVEDIRGVDSGAVIKALLDRRLLKILGKKEEVGRPILYGTTEEFLQFFALKDLSALPTLREFQELTQEHQEIVEKEAPGVQGIVAELADPALKQKMEEASGASEAALEELEAAIGLADESGHAAAAILNPPKPPEAEGIEAP